MTKTIIYILTHKKFDYKEDGMHLPLLNGSSLLKEDFGYIRDDQGDNISKLNPYYAELTGQYWAWKNSNAEIIGFCHYRRYFTKNLSLKIIEKEEIEEILTEYDIILPKKRRLDKTVIEDIDFTHKEFDICQKKEDYDLLREIIKEDHPDYIESFDEFLNSSEIYWFNMYILKKELFDEYFNWLYDILEKFRLRNDFSTYEEGNTRVLGYLSERLLNVFIIKNKLKIKEKNLLLTESRNPYLAIIHNRSRLLQRIFRVK